VSESIVADTAARIFADLADPQAVNSARSENWKAPLWLALTEAGLTLAWVPDDLGGAGAGLADGFQVLEVAGRYAVPVPLAETMLAGWLLAQGGIASPEGAMTLAPVRPRDRITINADGTLTGRARGVPFATEAAHVAVLAESGSGFVIALVDAKSATPSSTGRSMAGDALNDVTFDKVTPLKTAPAPKGFDKTSLMLMGAAARSVETAGALQTILALSTQYAQERVAFGKPIAKFQAVQHNLARLAGEAAAAMMAAGSAADTLAGADLASYGDAEFLEAAAARIRSAEAATEGSAIAHQVFGAIGITKEHVLHRFTLRVLSWRDDFGNESQWALDLGNRVAARGADELWPLVASR
jgi:alkylation response protein AidB-like acyl-CoA dehydrogenase